MEKSGKLANAPQPKNNHSADDARPLASSSQGLYVTDTSRLVLQTRMISGMYGTQRGVSSYSLQVGLSQEEL